MSGTDGNDPVDRARKAFGTFTAAPGHCFKQCVTSIFSSGQPSARLGDVLPGFSMLCCWKHLFPCGSHEGQLWAVKSGQCLRAAAPWERRDVTAEMLQQHGECKVFYLLIPWASPFPLGVPEEQGCCPQGQAGLGQLSCSQCITPALK